MDIILEKYYRPLTVTLCAADAIAIHLLLRLHKFETKIWTQHHIFALKYDNPQLDRVNFWLLFGLVNIQTYTTDMVMRTVLRYGHSQKKKKIQ